jgi:hypothetical protein
VGASLTSSIPERELESRDDLRAERVFTIDPPTAKDLDDALDIKKAEDGTFKVRVHIADVSYFGQLLLPIHTGLRTDEQSRQTLPLTVKLERELRAYTSSKGLYRCSHLSFPRSCVPSYRVLSV